MTKKLQLVYSIYFTLASVSLMGQDIHFSHIHASPLTLNPAMTGVFNDGDIRFIVNSRLQWQNFTNGYKTVAASTDIKLFQLDNTSVFSGGLQVASDRAGDLGFSTSIASMNIAVLKGLDKAGRNHISLGMQGGYYQNKFDISKMRGYGTDQLVLDGLEANTGYWDYSIGLAWYNTIDAHNYFYLGASMFHINNPVVGFTELENYDFSFDEEDTGKVLYRRKVIHGGGMFRLAQYMTALPSFIWMDQGPHQQIKMGSFVKFKQSRSFKKSDKALYLGAWVRWYIENDVFGTDALDLSFRYDIKRTIFTFSFDINVSSLSRASRYFGGPEFSVIQVLGGPNTRMSPNKVKCPIL